MNISVLGAGTWGTTLAEVLYYNEHQVSLWHYREKFVKQLLKDRTHPKLKNHTISRSIHLTHKISELPLDEMIITAVPSQNLRESISKIPIISKDVLFVNASKGIEVSSLMRMSEVINNVTGLPFSNIISLHGPSHAEEVIQKLPTTVVSACENIHNARIVQKVFSNEYFRIYSNVDIIGVEMGGAVKNVIAIAAGICTGIGYGDNTLSALITRGLAELQRLGAALGANKETFSGLSGLGDLIVTSTSSHSRNRLVGEQIGKGRKLLEIIKKLGMVAEGIETAKSIHQLMKKLKIDMPICEQVYETLFNQKNPRDAIRELMTRTLVDEHKD